MDNNAAWVVTTHDWAISVDEDHLEHIRQNPAIYAQGGLRHMMLEVLAYAADEATAAGRVGTATVTVRPDGSVSIRDDGRGTDTRRTPQGHIIRKPVMATRDVRFFDNPDRSVLPDGLPRWGMSVVAALSSTLIHQNRRASGGWIQTYHHGMPATELIEIADDGTTGTTVTFTLETPTDTHRSLRPSDRSAFSSLRVSLDDAPS
ncbi:ATP-binding protein [Microlunatus sp. GCM10028923]|uniref:ATP-binding protein n=1 Tax=Microlunatus sp. GCM10028923 TaxID=3273400 RepID=UPI00361853B5